MAAPIKPTCPDINRALKHLDRAILELNGEIENPKVEKSIIYEIEQAANYFEELRKSNDQLRNWGEDLENQLQTAAEEINSLENRLEETKQST